MTNILFCNSTEPACGVYQYGRNFYHAISTKSRFNFIYAQPTSLEEMMVLVEKHEVAAVLYNWHPDQGGFIKEAPYKLEMNGRPIREVLIYHDWEPNTVKFDAVLFSDPTMKPHTNWIPVPRPLPPTVVRPEKLRPAGLPVIGVHGFYGASSDRVVEQVMKDFDAAIIRLHLPFAYYGDREGKTALELAQRSMELAQRRPGFEVQVSHEWLDTPALIAWLADNDLNCYLRDTAGVWRGVSSALDAALAARRPIAVNRCQGFRHAFDCTPSILIEDRTLKEILSSGLAPLQPLYDANTNERLAARVESVLLALVGNTSSVPPEKV